jgi:deazaflavin-dependent oxidoreductase (nitroreductase family)
VTDPAATRSDSRLERVAAAAVASRPGAWFYIHVAPHIDRALIRVSRGRLTTAGASRVGLLKVRGARSGIERHTPLVYTRDGDDVLLVASRGGDVSHPAWYRNLVANPDVRFAIRGDERPYRARTAGAEERRRLWELVNRTYRGYAAYQRRAGDREIPVVVLEPPDSAYEAAGSSAPEAAAPSSNP